MEMDWRKLVNEGELKEEEVVEAINLIHQNRPSVIELLRKFRLGASDIYQLINLSKDSGKSILQEFYESDHFNEENWAAIISESTSLTFEMACRELGFLSKPSEAAGENVINQAALDSLRELGTVSEAELSGLENSSPTIKESNDESEAEGEGVINAAALESLKELGMVPEEELKSLESGLADEDNKSDLENSYLKIFTEDLFSEMNSHVDVLSDRSARENIFENMMKLKGAARLENAKISTKLIDGVLEHFEKIRDGAMGEDQVNFLKNALNILWSLRESIKLNGSEAMFWKDEIKKSEFVGVLRELKSA